LKMQILRIEDDMSEVASIPTPQRKSLIVSMANRYGFEPKPFEEMIRKTVMPSGHTIEEFAGCMLVAHQHGLNPITREIFFMKTKGGGIQPIVSVDGWATIVNTHPQFDGMEFFDKLDDKGGLVSITCKMYRKDRSKPVEVTEYMGECKGDSPAWKKTPGRMLRHRSMIQCARYAFGFAGIMEQDEFDQWQAAPVQKSAHRARKDGDFERIKAAVAACQSDQEITEWLALNTDDVGALPSSWQEHLAEHVAARRRLLETTIAEEADPIADEQGVIDAVQADYSRCDCEDDVIAAREKWEPVIARLSPANRTIAAGILVVPE
jgi:phage recombination protein Bet